MIRARARNRNWVRNRSQDDLFESSGDRALSQRVARVRSIQSEVTNRLFTDTRGEPSTRARGVHQDNHRSVVLREQANLCEERSGAAVVPVTFDPAVRPIGDPPAERVSLARTRNGSVDPFDRFGSRKGDILLFRKVECPLFLRRAGPGLNRFAGW